MTATDTGKGGSAPTPRYGHASLRTRLATGSGSPFRMEQPTTHYREGSPSTSARWCPQWISRAPQLRQGGGCVNDRRTRCPRWMRMMMTIIVPDGGILSRRGSAGRYASILTSALI